MESLICVLLEKNNTQLASVSLELIHQANHLASQTGGTVVGVLVCENYLDIPGLDRLALSKLHIIQRTHWFDCNLVAEELTHLCGELHPEILLLGATNLGRAVAPLVAGKLSTGLTADCTQLELGKSGKLRQIRPAFQEKVLAEIATSTLPQMATVRPGVLKIPTHPPTGSPEILVSTGIGSSCFTLLEQSSLGNTVPTCSQANILVVLGGGLQRQEDIPLFTRWAESLGGEIASSRALVQRGWFTVERQIGLSGSTANASLMITLGVSGSVQFCAGIAKVKELIAINTDPRAPIFSQATGGICLDLNQLAEELRKTGG